MNSSEQPASFAAQATALRSQILGFVQERTDAIIRRFLPDLQWPRLFAGYAVARNDVAYLAHLIAALHELGVREVAGHATSEIISAAMRQVDGAAAESFASFSIAESLLPFGPFRGNPILQEFTEIQRTNIIEAVDSTHIYDPQTNRLRGLPNNYWAVLARCEFRRQELGLLDDDSALKLAIAMVRQALEHNPLGFFDDSNSFLGRYDCYSAYTFLILEPLWPLLDADVLDRSLRAHTRLLESIAMENGASVVWGRSIGALSVCLTMEMGATAMHLKLAEDPTRMLGIIANAFAQFRTWFADDLIIAHRGRMTFKYRDAHRLLQMSLDCLDKLCATARHLSVAEGPPAADMPLLFPPRDEWISFGDRNAGVWMYRRASLAFQFAVVDDDGAMADYVPWFRGPGVFENPVDSPMLSGVPRVFLDDAEFMSDGLPTLVEKHPDQLRLVYDGFRGTQRGDSRRLTGRREVTYTIRGGQIMAGERWSFDTVPTALSLDIAEADRPLTFVVNCPTPYHVSTVAVEGMQAWRSFWGELRQLHQVRFEPAREITFTYTLTMEPDRMVSA
jgi:hypothetical protein